MGETLENVISKVKDVYPTAYAVKVGCEFYINTCTVNISNLHYREETAWMEAVTEIYNRLIAKLEM